MARTRRLPERKWLRSLSGLSRSSSLNSTVRYRARAIPDWDSAPGLASAGLLLTGMFDQIASVDDFQGLLDD